MTLLASIGRTALDVLRRLNNLAAVLLGVLSVALRPIGWRRTVREATSRQIVATGVEAVGFVSFIALVAGLLIVVQVQVWLNTVAQSRLLGPVLVTIVIRELAPLMTNFVLIARSGTGYAAELGNMKIAGEVRALDAQGVDPFVYLVVPRVLAATVSTFCLTVLFVLVCLTGGYLCARLTRVYVGGPSTFAFSVTRAIGAADIVNIVTKTIVPAFIWGAICCVEGLAVGATRADVTRAASRSLQRAIIVTFVILAAVSVLTYA
jgi:phospholipid/cholesterol/gamma-HCH transport system permease protein